MRAERRRRLAESPLAFPTHGGSIRQYRQALYEFEKSGGGAARPSRTRSTEDGLAAGALAPDTTRVLPAPATEAA